MTKGHNGHRPAAFTMYTQASVPAHMCVLHMYHIYVLYLGIKLVE